MILVRNIRLPLSAGEPQAFEKALREGRIPRAKVQHLGVAKLSVDARRGQPKLLFRNHMDQHRVVDLFRLAENTDQPLNIMSIHRSQIRDSHIFKPHARNQKLLDAVLCPEQRADQIRTDHRDPR